MEDISNKTLATILIVTIVISLGTTLVTLNSIHDRGLSITGRAATGQGTARVNITSSLSILMLTNSVDFGDGRINASVTNCASNGVNISTLRPDFNIDNCWCNVSGYALGMPAPFHIENDGTVNVSIQVIGASNVTFFNSGAIDSSNQNYVWAMNSSAANCNLNAQTAWTQFDASANLCDDLNWSDESDDLYMDVLLAFDGNTPTGVKTDTITFTASAS